MRAVHTFRKGTCQVNILEDEGAEDGQRYAATFIVVDGDDPIVFREERLDDLARGVKAASEVIEHLHRKHHLSGRIVFAPDFGGV